MTQIDLPEQVAQTLVAGAAAHGLPLADYVASLTNVNGGASTGSRITYHWEDHDFINEAISEVNAADVDVDATRKALAKISGSLADDISKHREERR